MKWLLAITTLFISSSAEAASRCECGPPKSIKEYETRAYSVFIGTVNEIDRVGATDKARVGFDVDVVWKGPQSDHLSVITVDDRLVTRSGVTSGCGFKFTTDEDYLVFSYRRTTDQGPGWTSFCWPTRLLADSYTISLIKHLGEPRKLFQLPELFSEDEWQAMVTYTESVEDEYNKPDTAVHSNEMIEPTPLPGPEVQPYMLPTGKSAPKVQMPYIDR